MLAQVKNNYLKMQIQNQILVADNFVSICTMSALKDDGKIDSDFCLEIQECVDGITEPTIETESFLEVEDCERICGECKYHL